MRMPGIARPPLPDHLEALRAVVMALPIAERRQLMRAINGAISRQNDARHQLHHERAEKARNRRRPDSRQMALQGAA